MRSARLLSAVAALAATAAASDASDVLDLTAKNFGSTVTPEKLMLVEFFAPWCGHCKALKPEYETAATELKNLSIKLAKVDCTAEAELCSEHGVQGYPTLKVFENGQATDYGGTRKSDGIVSFMKKRSLPAVSIVSAENHTDFTKVDRVVLVAYLDEADSKSRETFDAFAGSHRDEYAFGLSTDPAVASSVGSIEPPSVVLYKTFDEGRNDLVGSFTPESLAEFAQRHSVPLFDEISPSNFAMYAESGLPLAYVFVEATDASRESLIKSLEPIAKAQQGKINFVWIDALKFADHAKSLNLPEPKWPSFAIQNVMQQEKFPLEQAKGVNFATVDKFVKDFVAGKVAPSVKSAAAPKVQDGPVHILVADEFDQVIYGDKNDKDAFVEFYAPWCGHCKKLAPTWDILGERFSHAKEKLLIAKFDATENDVPSSAGFRIQGFPTIKFKPAGSREFIDYEGDRSLESLIEFVEQNAKNKVQAADGPAVTPDAEEEDEDEDEEVAHDEL